MNGIGPDSLDRYSSFQGLWIEREETDSYAPCSTNYYELECGLCGLNCVRIWFDDNGHRILQHES